MHTSKPAACDTILKAFSCIQNLLHACKAKGTPSSSTFFKLNISNMPQNGHSGPLRAQGRSSSKPGVKQGEQTWESGSEHTHEVLDAKKHYRAHFYITFKAKIHRQSLPGQESTNNGPDETSADDEGHSEQQGRVTEGWELPTQNKSTVILCPVKHS